MYRKVLFVALCLIALFSFCSVASAAEIEVPPPEDIGGPLDATFASSPHYTVESPFGYGIQAAAANTSVKSWWNSVSKVNAGVINMTSYTCGTGTSAKNQVYYNLQRYTGGKWVSYYTTTRSNSDRISFSDSLNKSVAGGYYYRVVTTHKTYSNGSWSAAKTATSGSIVF